MKETFSRWFWLITLLAVINAGCQITLLSPPAPTCIPLTEEERQVLIDHSFDPPKVVRWPDKTVIEVYDETGFPHFDYVLNEWNRCLEGKVTLVRAGNPGEAEIQIVFGDVEEPLSGRALTYYSDDGRIYRGFVTIDRPAGGYNVTTYLHELGHNLGCHHHLERGLMQQGSGLQRIDEYTRWYFNLLYSLPAGYIIC